jgi:hypothetical protein
VRIGAPSRLSMAVNHSQPLLRAIQFDREVGTSEFLVATGQTTQALMEAYTTIRPECTRRATTPAQGSGPVDGKGPHIHHEEHPTRPSARIQLAVERIVFSAQRRRTAARNCSLSFFICRTRARLPVSSCADAHSTISVRTGARSIPLAVSK